LNRIINRATELAKEAYEACGRISPCYLINKFKYDVLCLDTERDMAIASQLKGIRPFIAIPKWIPRVERRHFSTHECSHQILHKGNKFAFTSSLEHLITDKYEYQAELFTAHYLIPDFLLLDKLRKANMTIYELSDYFDVPDDLLQFRLAELEKRTLINRNQC
jgi:Zn-dependent peptidase ImmA (M78 family)